MPKNIESGVVHLVPPPGGTILERYAAQAEYYREALEYIHDHGGQVCDDYELCTHGSCHGSSLAWMTAEAALNGRALP